LICPLLLSCPVLRLNCPFLLNCPLL
jgi:hypothetical protein